MMFFNESNKENINLGNIKNKEVGKKYVKNKVAEYIELMRGTFLKQLEEQGITGDEQQQFMADFYQEAQKLIENKYETLLKNNQNLNIQEIKMDL